MSLPNTTTPSADEAGSQNCTPHIFKHLHQAKIIVQKKGAFSAKSFNLVIPGTSGMNAILTAVPERGLLFSKGNYKVYSLRDSKTMTASDERHPNEIPCPCHHSSSSPIVPAQSILSDTIYENPERKEWEYLGKIENPGWFFDRSMIKNTQSETKGIVLYDCTSRTGDLMKMQVVYPCVYEEKKKSVTKMIADAAKIPIDCASLIAESLGNVYWSEGIANVTHDNCREFLLSDQSKDSLVMRNKLPVWNPAIAAYTLEFQGRALLPSVHNFQLVDESNEVVLQLGKVNNREFNMDFGFPLTPFQAFSTCMSVILRTFVWD